MAAQSRIFELGTKSLRQTSIETAAKTLAIEPNAYKLFSSLSWSVAQPVLDHLLDAQRQLTNMSAKLPLADHEMLSGQNVNHQPPFDMVDVRRYGHRDAEVCFRAIEAALSSRWRQVRWRQIRSDIRHLMFSWTELSLVPNGPTDTLRFKAQRGLPTPPPTPIRLGDAISAELLVHRLSGLGKIVLEPENIVSAWNIFLLGRNGDLIQFMYHHMQGLHCFYRSREEAGDMPRSLHLLINYLLAIVRSENRIVDIVAREAFGRRYAEELDEVCSREKVVSDEVALEILHGEPEDEDGDL